MAALVSVHNDGPDAVELRIGRQSILLQPGHDYRVATANAVEVCTLPAISAVEMAMHMGGRASDVQNRYAED